MGIDDNSDEDDEDVLRDVVEPRDDHEDERTVFGSASGSRFSTGRQSLSNRFGGFGMAGRKDPESHAMDEQPQRAPTFFSPFTEKVRSLPKATQCCRACGR